MKKKKIIIAIVIIAVFILSLILFVIRTNKSQEKLNEYEESINADSDIEYSYISLTGLDNEDVEKVFNEFVLEYTSEKDVNVVTTNIRKYSDADYYIATTFDDNTYSEFRYSDDNYGANVYNQNNMIIYAWPK